VTAVEMCLMQLVHFCCPEFFFWVPEPLLMFPFLTFLHGFQLWVGASDLLFFNSFQNLSLLSMWMWFWVSILACGSYLDCP
jgi:hypothetical protein